MSEEYDLRGGVRGKYAARYAEGTNVVVLDPDVADVFKDAKSVNMALRAIAAIISDHSRKPRASRSARTKSASDSR
jgi:hypothetical protein